jgi:hypothetical protein
VYLVQKAQTKSKWIRKAIRTLNISVISLNDFNRAFSWYVGGGKRFYSRHFHELVRAHKWCFVVGCNNSGTSLLQKILEESNVVSTLPYEGQMYTRVLARARKKGFERVWSEYAHELAVDRENSLKVAPRLLHDWVKDLKTPLHQVIVEKTPANIMRMGWLERAFPRNYFIGLIRNGYAVAEGIRRKGGKDIARAARHWNFVNKKMKEESKNVRRFLLIRYEQLSERPQETAAQLASFLDLDTDSVKRAVGKTFQFKTVDGSGNSNIQNFNSMSIARLSHDDIEEVYRNASEMLDYFLYEPR